MSGNAKSEPAAEATDLGRLEAGGCSDGGKEGAGGTGDGGWGWVVVLGTFIIFGVADGIMYSFGVFVEEFVDHFDCSKSAVGALGSLLTAVTFGVGNVYLHLLQTCQVSRISRETHAFSMSLTLSLSTQWLK